MLDPKRLYARRIIVVSIGDQTQRQADIEKHLSRRERDLLSIPATIIFYDLTNTHCTGQHDDQGLRRFGRSEQRRNDRPLVTLALVLDEMDFPRSSEILPGSVG